jgi:hypothetical protein
VQIFDARTGAFISQIDEVDVCGLSPSGDGFIATSGTGMIRYIGAESDPVQHDMAFDNHLIAV